MKLHAWVLTALLYALSLLTVAVSVSPALAQESAKNPYQLVQQGKIQPLEDILKVLRASYRGEIIDIDLEYDDGLYIYEIEMVGPQGQKAKFEFDAATGELVSLKGRRLDLMRKSEGALP